MNFAAPVRCRGSCQRWPSSRSSTRPAKGACLIACRCALCRPHGGRSSCAMASSIVPPMNYAPCRSYVNGCERETFGSREAGSLDRKRVVEGKGVSVRVDLGGRRILKKKNEKTINHIQNK